MQMQSVVETVEQVLENIKNNNDANSLRAAKVALIVAFNDAYSRSMEQWHIDYSQSSFWSPVPDPSKRSQADKDLEGSLAVVKDGDTPQALLENNFILQDSIINSLFNGIVKFLEDKKFLNDDRRHNIISPCVQMKVIVLQINLNYLNACMDTAKGEVFRYLALPKNDEVIDEKFLADRLNDLNQKSKEAYILEVRLNNLKENEENYKDSKISGCIPNGVFSTPQGTAHLNFIREVKRGIEQFEPVYVQTVKSASHANEVKLFPAEFTSECDAAHRSVNQTNPYTFSSTYVRSDAIARALKDCGVSGLPNVKVDYDEFIAFQAELKKFSDELNAAITTVSSQFESCEEDQVMDNYQALMAWKQGIVYMIELYRGNNILTGYMQDALGKVDEGILKLVARLEKVMRAMPLNLEVLKGKLSPEVIERSIKLFQKHSDSIAKMGIRSIREKKIEEIVQKFKAEIAEKFLAIITARVAVLEKQYEELDRNSLQNDDVILLSKLLTDSKKAFEDEKALYASIQQLCDTVGYTELSTYNAIFDKVSRKRDDVESKILTIRRSIALKNLQDVVNQLENQITGIIETKEFTRLFNDLYTKIEEHHRIAAGMQDKTVDGLFDGFVTGVLKPEIFRVDCLTQPFDYIMSHAEYLELTKLVEALRASKYNQRAVVKENLDRFSSAHDAMRQYIANSNQRLVDLKGRIISCTAVTYANVLQDLRYEFDIVCSDPNNFLSELMKNEEELLQENDDLLRAKKTELEAACNTEIVRLSDQIIAKLEQVLQDKELEDDEIIQFLANIQEVVTTTNGQGLAAPTEDFMAKAEIIKKMIAEIISSRYKKFNAILKNDDSGLTIDILGERERFLKKEDLFSQKLERVCGAIDLSSEYGQYAEELKKFKEDLVNQEFEFRFKRKADELQAFNSEESLASLSEEQKKTCVGIIEALDQMVKLRMISHSEDSLTMKVLGTVTKLVEAMHEMVVRYNNELITSAESWMVNSNLSLSTVNSKMNDFDSKMNTHAELDKKATEFLNLYRDSHAKRLFPILVKTIPVFVAERSDKLKLAYDGNIKIINNEKYKLMEQILNAAANENFTGLARFGTTATGIKELRSLKKKWDRFGDQQSLHLEDYFARVTKVINDRLTRNSKNENEKREQSTHAFYKKSKNQLDLLRDIQRSTWHTVMNAALDMGEYKKARHALIKLQPREESLVEPWVELTVRTLNKLLNDKSINQHERDKQVISALNGAQKVIAKLPIASRLKFYDDLMTKTDDAKANDDVLKLRQLLFVLRTSEDAKNPERKKHSKLGRATGVAKISHRLLEPKRILRAMKRKADGESRQWDWIIALIDKIVKIITERLGMANRDVPKRHVETKAFYEKTQGMYGQLTTILGGAGVDPVVNPGEGEPKPLGGSNGVGVGSSKSADRLVDDPSQKTTLVM